MNNFKLNFIAISALSIATFTSISANASFLVEPHLGYNVSGTATVGTDKLKYNGAQYGGRLGVQHLGVMAGLDYTHSTYTLTTTPASGTADKDEKKRDEIGLFVGYKFPIMFRAWVGYNFSAKETQTVLGPTSGNAVGEYVKGHSTEIGAGYTGLPFISINLSYKMISYDKQANAAGVVTALAPKIEPKEIVLGISAPFNFL